MTHQTSWLESTGACGVQQNQADGSSGRKRELDDQTLTQLLVILCLLTIKYKPDAVMHTPHQNLSGVQHSLLLAWEKSRLRSKQCSFLWSRGLCKVCDFSQLSKWRGFCICCKVCHTLYRTYEECVACCIRSNKFGEMGGKKFDQEAAWEVQAWSG